jgi:hypothetical protein
MNVIKKWLRSWIFVLLGWINKESNRFWRPGPECASETPEVIGSGHLCSRAYNQGSPNSRVTKGPFY